MSWNSSQDRALRRLIATDKYFLSEIGEKLGRTAGATRHRARKLGLNTKPAAHRFGAWNCKHAHLREKVMRFYLTHSAEECRERFKLTASEFKSLLTASYRDKTLSHLRKDKRTHAPWERKDWLFALRRAGLIERRLIAKQMGRSPTGKHHAVKDQMRAAGGGTTKFLNGMPIGWAKKLWPEDMILRFGVKTQAGPTGGRRGNFRFVLIPWVEADRMARVFVTPPEVAACIRAMAKFQRFIHMKRDKVIVRQLKRIARSV